MARQIDDRRREIHGERCTFMRNGAHRRLMGVVAALALFMFSGSAVLAGGGHGHRPEQLRLINGDGFGNPNNVGVGRVHAAQGYLFVGTWNDVEGMIVYRSRDGETFEQISQGGVDGNPNNFVSVSFAWFHGRLYASSWNSVDGGSIFRANATARYGGDVVWETISTHGMGNPANQAHHGFRVFKSHLYAGTFNFDEGTEIWRTASGDVGTWMQVAPKALGDPRNTDAANMIEHGGYLYAGIETARQPLPGTRIVRTDGKLVPPYDQWRQVNIDGFGNPLNHNVIAMEVFKGHLYGATWNVFQGAEVWRARLAPGHTKSVPFSNWEKVNENGFGNPTIHQAANFMVRNGSTLYAVGYAAFGPGRGFVFKTSNGTTWEELTGPDWPPPRGPGSGVYWATVFNGKVYLAVHNGAGPGSLWVIERK